MGVWLACGVLVAFLVGCYLVVSKSLSDKDRYGGGSDTNSITPPGADG